jgi:hypothetical protein
MVHYGQPNEQKRTDNAPIREKNTKLVSGSIWALVFALLLIAFGISSFGLVFSEGNPIPVASIIIGTVILIMQRIKRKKLTDTYFKLVSSGCYNIKSLAAHSKVEVDVATKHLRQMIDFGYFENGYIDSNMQCIVVKAENKERTDLPTSAGKCCYCGAPLVGMKGQVARCQYCDADQQL